MSRKLVGGAVILTSDLERALVDHVGIILKIPNPRDQSGVSLKLYGALIGQYGIAEGEEFDCTLESCSIEKEEIRSDLQAYEYEHCAEFSLFDSTEPFIAFFSRSQIEMLSSLGNYHKVFISSFMPVSSNPLVNQDELIPNFNLEMQPYGLPKANQSDSSDAPINTYGLPGTIRAAGCPRTWRKE